MGKKLLALLVTLLFAASAFAQTAVIQSHINVYNRIPTYIAAGTFTVAATATDAITLTGSATKTIYVKNLKVACTMTTAGQVDLYLIKRTAVNTAGTFVGATELALDSSDSAPTAVAGHYTANPSGLGAGTTIDISRVSFLAPATAAANVPFVWTWGQGMGRYLTLRAATQLLAVNLNGATTTGATCSYTVEWMEY